MTCREAFVYLVIRLFRNKKRRRFLADSLPLDGCRGLGRYVVDDAVDVLDLVYDTRRNFNQHVVRNIRPVGCHTVHAGDGTQSDRVVVGAFVAHYAHGTHAGKHGEVLPDFAVETGFGDFLAEDPVGVLQNAYFGARDVADNTASPGPGNG